MSSNIHVPIYREVYIRVSIQSKYPMLNQCIFFVLSYVSCISLRETDNPCNKYYIVNSVQ